MSNSADEKKLKFEAEEIDLLLQKVKDGNLDVAIPVQSVNGKIGDVTLSADDVKARPDTWTPSAADVGADSAGTASSAVTEHNTATDAHNDIRLWLSNVETWVKNLLDADDETLNQTSEMIAYMKDNRELIEQITTGKVSVTDIINNLTTNVSDKPLSAAQGVVLKGLIDALQTAVNSKAASTDLTAHTGNSTVHITVAERTAWNKNTTDIESLSEEIADVKNSGVGAIGVLNMADAICPPNQLAADGSMFGDYDEATEELYTGVGCNPGSDFNGDTIVYADIVNYIDEVIVDHPQYVHKEAMGLDESGDYTINRYVMSQCYYRAWQRQNYPKMYAWVNGSTKIYSVSISPRIGDVLYSTPYIGTSYGTVSAVDSANQTRTVGGVVFTRAKANDVEPTLLYTEPSCMHKTNGNRKMMDATKATVTTLDTQIQAITDGAASAGVSYINKLNEVIRGCTIVADNGYTYIRYPIGDRNEDMSVPIKVAVGCNEHGGTGDFPEPAICCARLIKDLANNVDNRMLNFLRKNTIVLAVPVINPWGFSKHGSIDGYRNYNGININRNYDTPGWNANADTGPSGEYAGSENETQYFMNTVCLADVAVSYHDMGKTEQTCAYQFNGYLNQNPNAQTTPKEVSVKNAQIAEVMLTHYNWAFVYYNEAPPATMAKSPSFITHAGCTGGLIEMCASQGAIGEADYGCYTPLVMEGDYSLMLMTLYSFIHDYDKTVRI